MSEAEQEKSLVLLGRGKRVSDICRALRLSYSTWTNTLEAFPEFRAATERMYALRMKEVEVTAFKLAMGGTKTVKTTYQAQFNKDGSPQKDENGEQKMCVVKREVTTVPANWHAVEFLLKTRMPEVYASKALAHDHNTESLETIRALLEGKAKELEAAKQPPQFNILLQNPHITTDAQMVPEPGAIQVVASN
jgi:hypothetical protein